MTSRSFDKAPAVLPMYLKAALPALPVVGALPGIKHATGEIPDLTVTRDGVSTDPEHLEAFNEVCGFGLSDTLPATYPHLAAFGLHMTLMTDTSFPFAPMGLVHLRNSITQHRPIGISETLDVRVHADNLRPHPKGRLADLVTAVTSEGELVWEEVTTLFARGEGRGDETVPPPLEGVDAPVGPTRWRLKDDLGRRYAAVSGDRNPIHLYALTAKAFGFSRQIAHGMWTEARCLAALAGRLPEAYRVDVEFRKPILLPASVNFGAVQETGTTTFGVTSPPRSEDAGPTAHLVGRVVPL